MPDASAPRAGGVLIKVIWAVVILVAVLGIVVAYLLYRLEAQRADSLVSREIAKTKAPEASKSDDPQAQIVEGELHYREGRADEAINAFERALKKDPENPRALIDLGTVLAQQRRYDEAVAKFNEVVRLREKSQYSGIDIYLGEAYFQRGSVASSQNRCSDAIPDLKKALSITRMDADAFFTLGHCYMVLREEKNALTYLGRAVEFDPTFAQAHYEMGLVFERTGKTKEAIESYNHAVMSEASHRKAAEALARLQDEGGE